MCLPALSFLRECAHAPAVLQQEVHGCTFSSRVDSREGTLRIVAKQRRKSWVMELMLNKEGGEDRSGQNATEL